VVDQAAETGKHVLCEKPISITVAEAKTLLAARDRTGVKIGEAFMVKTHPQWLRTQEIIRSGGIGELRPSRAFLAISIATPATCGHKVEWGGGGLLDIGCYPITMSRFIFAEEPVRVAGVLERDPGFQDDRLASAILEFPWGNRSLPAGTQTAFFQRMHFLGTSGRVEIEIPWNAPNDRPCRIFLGDVLGGAPKVEEFPVVDQYTIQGMSSPARCVANVTFRCRSKTPSRIWRSSRRYSRQRSQGGGKDRGSINCKYAPEQASAVDSEVEIETISVTMVTLVSELENRRIPNFLIMTDLLHLAAMGERVPILLAGVSVYSPRSVWMGQEVNLNGAQTERFSLIELLIVVA